MKRKIALMVAFCSILTSCGNVTAEEVTPVQSQIEKVGNSIKGSFTDEEIEKRIKEVGEAYDGLLDTTDDYFGYGMTNSLAPAYSLKGGIMTDSMAEATVGAPAPQGILPGGCVIDIPPEDWNTESYNNIDESGIVSTQAQPFSTFGADVDTASYSSLRRHIYEDDGKGITDNALRVEELINYFNYDYPKPKNGDKFGVQAALTACPWSDDNNTMLLRVGIKAEEVSADKGSNIVFLIDTSGSMFDNNKLPLAQKAFKLLQEQLTEKDTVSIVTYAGNEEVVAEGVKGTDRDKIVKAIDSLEAWGSTNGEGGINKAYEIAEKYFIDGGNNRVILATDGDLNVGVSSEAGLIDLVEHKRDTGVFLSCLGFGSGNYQDDKMEGLADHGNGNYAYIDCSREAERVLKDEFWSTLYTVAKDVKFQIEFNPEQVKGYRLIGYENRTMAAEDFNNDKKDGGEVGSGQTVTVLYEIITKDSTREIPSVTSRYGNTASNTVEDTNNTINADELLTVSIRYKEPDASESKLIVYPVTKDFYFDGMDNDTSWAAGVAQFGMLVRDSEYKGTSTYQSIYDRLKQDPEVMSDDFKAEFLYIISKLNNKN